ncbi:hypothetical protein N7454_000949 [Penicillium verhagenii]|nr:hypothetical protein N7454_000949 [Penicillium verhagenii]
MANLESISMLSEAAYGCEHLAAFMEDVEAAAKFKIAFRKMFESLAPYTKVEPVAVQTTGLRTLSSLKPKYHCVSCPEVCLSTERKAHTKKTGHLFYMESRNRVLHCETCLDLVYDHGLERLCGPQAKFEYAKGAWIADPTSEAYVKTNAYKNPCSRRGARGVWNMGQTCYQSVILQALLHDQTLNAYFLAGGHDIHTCERNFCMACATTEVFMEFNSGEKTDAVSAATLLYHGWGVSRDMAGYRQQDAHEYFQFLVNALHAATPGHSESHDTKCECFFHRTFYGELQSSVMCHKCGKTTNTFDPMADLSLDVQLQNKKRKMGPRTSSTPATLTGCLDNFTARASKRLQIRKLPSILCMHLKRYEHNSSSSEKMHGHIDFPLSLNMLPYTIKKDKERVDTSQYIYDLSTVVVHQGSMDSGHYYAYTRLICDKWVLMDDNKVTVVSIAEVLRQDAYLLFYSIRSIGVERG